MAPARVGLTDFAQQTLGDIVDISRPGANDRVTPGQACGDIESTKSVNDLLAPGVRRRDGDQRRSPRAAQELVNTHRYGGGWLIDVRLGPGAPLPPTCCRRPTTPSSSGVDEGDHDAGTQPLRQRRAVDVTATMTTPKASTGGTLLSVNVGMPHDVQWRGRTVHTGIGKYPVGGTVMVRRLNVDGDGQGDKAGHGGERARGHALPGRVLPVLGTAAGARIARVRSVRRELDRHRHA